jgi:hypothetical protein
MLIVDAYTVDLLESLSVKSPNVEGKPRLTSLLQSNTSQFWIATELNTLTSHSYTS